MDKTYTDGLNDAWELTRKLINWINVNTSKDDRYNTVLGG